MNSTLFPRGFSDGRFDRRAYSRLVSWGSSLRPARQPLRGHRYRDEFIRELICKHLSEDTAIDAVDVSVDVQDAEVTLTGTVASHEQKRAIEDFLADFAGVAEVHDMLAVRSEEPANRFDEF